MTEGRAGTVERDVHGHALTAASGTHRDRRLRDRERHRDRAGRLHRRLGTLTFTPGQTTQTVTRAGHRRPARRGDETFFVNLTNPSNATITDGQGLGHDHGRRRRADALDQRRHRHRGRHRHGRRDVHRHAQHASGRTVTVDYATADGTATAPADYRRRAARSPSLPADDEARSPSRSTATCSTRRTRPSSSTSRNPRTRRSPTPGPGHDHRRRRRAGALDRRRDGDRGQPGTVTRDVHGHAERRRAAARSPSTTRPRTARPGARRLPGDERDADVHAGPDHAEVTVLVNGDLARRDRRDLLRQPLQPDQRDDRRQPGRRHDHRRRRAARALDRRRDGHRGQLGHGQRELQRHA